jgi:K+:H+ antiporter
MEQAIFTDIIIIFSVSLVVVYLFNKLKVPAIVGFLFSGILIGPSIAGLISDHHQIEILGEIGVILLLFSIGVEFSVSKLIELRKTILLGGGTQVIATIGITILLMVLLGQQLSNAVFFGFLVALSSTAIVLNMLSSSGAINTKYGQMALGVLIFQDIIIVVMMLLTPMIAGEGGDIGPQLLNLFLKIGGLLVIVFIAGRWVFPFIMLQVARTRIRELFLLSILTIVSLIVLLTHVAGISLALGAFIAGLIVSESDYNHHALASVVPFKDIFSSIFFVSIGMMLDVTFLIDNILTVSIVILVLLAIKFITGSLAALVMKHNLATIITTGFTIIQIGEFSFVLSTVGMQYNLIDGELYQLFLSSAVITMAMTPFLLMLGPKIASKVSHYRNRRLPTDLDSQISDNLSNHLVIIGFGLNGRNVAMAARRAEIPYIIIEMNPDTVRKEKAKGEPIFYGDAQQEEVLNHAKLSKASIAVVAIADSSAIRNIARTIKHVNEKIYLIVRTRFVTEVQELLKIGSDDVIPEEYETALVIFRKVLEQLNMPEAKIHDFVNEIRDNSYEAFRIDK